MPERKPDSQTSSRNSSQTSVLRSPRRLALAGLGFVFVGLALAGVFMPGLPTTIFLIVASYLFTKSCPVLEERLLGSRIFRPYLPYVRGDQPMPRKARIAALTMMWGAATASVTLLAVAGRLAAWSAGLIVAAVIAGSVFILTVRPERKRRWSSPTQTASR